MNFLASTQARLNVFCDCHTHPIMKPLRILSGLLLLAFIATGCATRQAPDPSLTAVGGPFGTGSSADWLDADQLGRAGQLGLSERDPAFGAGADGYIRDMFSPVYFDFDQSFVRPADRPTLQQVAAYLAGNPRARLIVEGHCDWRGTTEYNMALGDRRANSVKAYLVQLGVTSDRIETVSKGDLEAATDGTEAQMQQDRRGDLLIVPGQ
jgi:peptidoglycan-associated lipoprotein